jgi:uncharacterized membrane protein YbjE (DUF340 family)
MMVSVVFGGLISLIRVAAALKNGLAETPQMGWGTFASITWCPSKMADAARDR